MKSLMFILSLLLGVSAMAQVPVPAVSATPDVLVIAQPELPSPPTEMPSEYLVKMVDTLKALPVVGPLLVEGGKWLGALAAILTALVAFLLLCIRTLAPLLTKISLVGAATKVKSFEKSKIMYWLKYLSIFNAKKE